MWCPEDRVPHQDPCLGKGLLHTSKGLSAQSCLCSKSWLHHHINNNWRAEHPYSNHVMRMHEVSHLGWQRILAKMSVSQVLFVFLVPLASIILVQSQFCLKVTSGVVQWPLKHWFSHLKEEKRKDILLLAVALNIPSLHLVPTTSFHLRKSWEVWIWGQICCCYQSEDYFARKKINS